MDHIFSASHHTKIQIHHKNLQPFGKYDTRQKVSGIRI